MQVTPQKSTVISYLPQEIRETRLTEVTYLPITREMLEPVSYTHLRAHET